MRYGEQELTTTYHSPLLTSHNWPLITHDPLPIHHLSLTTTYHPSPTTHHHLRPPTSYQPHTTHSPPPTHPPPTTLFPFNSPTCLSTRVYCLSRTIQHQQHPINIVMTTNNNKIFDNKFQINITQKILNQITLNCHYQMKHNFLHRFDNSSH